MIIGFGTSSASDAYTTTSSNSLSEMLWRHDTLLFTATGSSTLLSFGSLATDGNCCYGPALDNVSVTAVPEATTWAVMLGVSRPRLCISPETRYPRGLKTAAGRLFLYVVPALPIMSRPIAIAA
jgi:hypothetical protein